MKYSFINDYLQTIRYYFRKTMKAIGTHAAKSFFKCRLCHEIFVNQRDLNLHSKNHPSLSKFKCDLCEKRFLRKPDFNLHLRVHTDERPYKCLPCNKSFKQLNHLKVHDKIHSGQKLFKCEYCVKKFIQKIQLINHTRIHTGERPFKCNICNRAYAQVGNLRTHEKFHSKEIKNYELCHYYKKMSVKKTIFDFNLQRHAQILIAKNPWNIKTCFVPLIRCNFLVKKCVDEIKCEIFA